MRHKLNQTNQFELGWEKVHFNSHLRIDLVLLHFSEVAKMKKILPKYTTMVTVIEAQGSL
jgi:hypothetical protein